MFKLDKRLREDCFEAGRFNLCMLLMMNDVNYPWFILVPMREGIKEIHELSEADQTELIKESSFLSRKVAEEFNAEKMNVAAIGNIVPQLHIHHVARYKDDMAWPAPVWGAKPAKPYSDEEKRKVLSKLGDFVEAYKILQTKSWK